MQANKLWLNLSTWSDVLTFVFYIIWKNCSIIFLFIGLLSATKIDILFTKISSKILKSYQIFYIFFIT